MPDFLRCGRRYQVMTIEEISAEFSDEVALLVDGVTKLGQPSHDADKVGAGRKSARCFLPWQRISVLF